MEMNISITKIVLSSGSRRGSESSMQPPLSRITEIFVRPGSARLHMHGTCLHNVPTLIG